MERQREGGSEAWRKGRKDEGKRESELGKEGGREA